MLELTIIQNKSADVYKLFLDRSDFLGYILRVYDGFSNLTLILEPKFGNHTIGFLFVDEKTSFEQIETLKKYLTKFKNKENYDLEITITSDSDSYSDLQIIDFKGLEKNNA